MCRELERIRQQRAEFERLVELLEHGPDRSEAAALLRHYPAWALVPLCGAVRSNDARTRRAAATSLGQLGAPRAVEVLCVLLEDTDVEVQAAAAHALGRIGDTRALAALMHALHLTIEGRSRREYVLAFVGGLVGVVCFGFLLGPIPLLLVGHGIVVQAKGRWRASRLSAALTGALGDMAERNPTPELRRAVPDLRVVSADVFHYPYARFISKEAAQRIEAATAHLKQLPIPSGLADLPLEALPLPASPER